MTIVQAFAKELDSLQDQDFKVLCTQILDSLPQYIVTQPSSTTGKYHPTDEISEDGMIRHIKRVHLYVLELCRMYNIKPVDQDVLLAGAIFHDVLKMGPEDIDPMIKVYTDPKHPIYIYKKLIEWKDKTTDENLQKKLYRLALVCLYHEGQWTIPESKATDEPKTDYMTFLCDVMHMADYFASRRSLYEIMQPSYFNGVKNG